MARLSRFRLPPLHPLQRQVADHPARYRVIAAGRRWGKTRCAAALCLHSALQHGRVFWIAPTYKIAEVGWREIKWLAQQVNAAIREQDKRVTLRQSFGWIQVRSADDPQSLRGEGLNFVVFDEAAYTKEEAWTEAIRPALADRQGRALFISSPNGKNWFHRLWEYGQHGVPGWQSWQFPTASNPSIPPAEIEAARAEMFGLTFQQEFMAEFVDASGAVLKREWLQTGEPAGKPTVVLGVDLALSTQASADWTAIVAMSQEPSGTLYVRDAQRIRAPFHQVLLFIQQMAAKWNPAIIAIEAVQYQAAVVQELLRTTRLPVRGVRPDKDKLTRFLPLAARYEQGLVKHAPGLPGWFEDELLAFPVGGFDDACFVANTKIIMQDGRESDIINIRSGDFVLTPTGPRRVLIAGCSSASSEIVEVMLANGITICGTANHPIYVPKARAFIPIGNLQKGDILCQSKPPFTEALITVDTLIAKAYPCGAISTETVKDAMRHCIGGFGKITTGLSRWVSIFTTKTRTLATTLLKTLNALPRENMERRTDTIMTREMFTSVSGQKQIENIKRRSLLLIHAKNVVSSLNLFKLTGLNFALQSVANYFIAADQFARSALFAEPSLILQIQPRLARSHVEQNGIEGMKPSGIKTGTHHNQVNYTPSNAPSVVPSSNHRVLQPAFVPTLASSLDSTGYSVIAVNQLSNKQPVYALQVEGNPVYYANGVLVHNCDAAAYAWQALGMARGGPVGLKVAGL